MMLHLSETAQDRRQVTIVLAYRKSDTSFRSVPKLVTLNDFERSIWPLFRVISPKSVAFGANYVTVEE